MSSHLKGSRFLARLKLSSNEIRVPRGVDSEEKTRGYAADLDTRANRAMDQTPRRAALASLPALVIAGR